MPIGFITKLPEAMKQHDFYNGSDGQIDKSCSLCAN